MTDWQPIETAPDKQTVLTKIDDAQGERNVQRLKRSGRLWFVPDGGTYVYYTPTHWAPLSNQSAREDGFSESGRQHHGD